MKASTCAAALALILACPVLYASSGSKTQSRDLPGKVVGLEKRDVQSPGDRLTTPTDAPLSAQYFSYDVAVRVNCEVYVARYDTSFDYVPAVFHPGQDIQVRTTRHVMYLDAPDNPEFRLPIVHRSADGSCPASN